MRRAAALAAALLWLPLTPPSAAADIGIEARLGRGTISLGESTTLELIIRGGTLNEAPQFDTPAGIEVLGTSQSRNFSWINGRVSNETVFRYEIGANTTGHYQLGPILVRVNGQAFRSNTLALDVTAAPQQIGGGDGGSRPATLVVEVTPREPYVGQPVVMRVRLIQRIAFAEDPQYTPPTTTGFWTDKPSPPESYYADLGGQRVLVTETRTRLYPLAAGPATIGVATAAVVLAGPMGGDPFALGRAFRREMVLRSAPVTVRVRALPAGAPASFRGAVGNFGVRWSADRRRTARDVPVTLRLEVRGTGNLPLLRPPELEEGDIELFASVTDDSLGESGGGGSGRKRFQWTVLPKRQGTIAILAPELSWFDPAARLYRRLTPPAVTLEVGPAAFAGASAGESFPRIFREHPIHPGARGPEPWGWAIAGLILGAALALWRAGGRRPAHAAERARVLEWLRAVGMGSGPDFWRAAEEASAWLEERAGNEAVRALRAQIAAARYGGARGEAEAIRRPLVERLSRALPPAGSGLSLRIAAVALALGAIGFAVALGPRPGDARSERMALVADQAARAGDLERARRSWVALWREGARHPALAARLAWLEAQGGAIGPAALWVLRGELMGPRDPALGWVAERVREGGGLTGARPARIPLTRLEWSALALLLGLAAGALWPRRQHAALAALLALAAGAMFPIQSVLAARAGRAVVLTATPLEGADVELQPGQMVTIEGSDRTRVRVSAGPAVEGWLPAAVVRRVESAAQEG